MFFYSLSIFKVGVGVENDAKRLFSDWGLEVNSAIDLRALLECANCDTKFFNFVFERRTKAIQLSQWTNKRNEKSVELGNPFVFLFKKIVFGC